MSMKLLASAFLALAFLIAGRTGLAEEPVKGAADAAAPVATSKVSAMSVSTFHCLSIYWSPENGEAGKKVMVKFREAAGADKSWHDGLAMRYNPVKTPECKGDYRGSIVNLKPGTAYE